MFPIAANRSDEENTTPYVDDVFSTYLWDNVDGTSNPVVNGIDLATKGGLVWMKKRTSSFDNYILYDTARGTTSALSSNTTDSQTAGYGNITYNTTGFTKGAGGGTGSFVGWTFRKAAKFFDVVTYTGNGTNNRAIAHSLGCEVGMIIVKKTSGDGQWNTWSRGFNNGNGYAYLNLTNGFTTNGGAFWGSYGAYVAPTSTSFTVSIDADVNASGQTYVAYLFAHDTAADGIIQCGSFTTNASGNATVDLGWEPQYIMWKRSDSTGSWYIQDTARDDLKVDFGGKELTANTSNAEGNSSSVGVTATGFVGLPGYTLTSSACIYVAIRRPNKPPTSGTQVFSAISRTGTGAAVDSISGMTFSPDLVICEDRSKTQLQGNRVVDRLRGVNSELSTISNDNEFADGTLFKFDVSKSIGITGGGTINVYSTPYINWNFKRAPGFFDVVCWTGTGSSTAINHNLTVAPQLYIEKSRSSLTSWTVAVYPTNKYGNLPSANAFNNLGVTLPTATQFTPIDTTSGRTFVSYLFASMDGVSKVGSFTGNGSSQNIECGFTSGARFILIKRTDASGNWYVWDAARGITTGNDPHVVLNTATAEVSNLDIIDPYSSGFTVNYIAGQIDINTSSATYIFLAIS